MSGIEEVVYREIILRAPPCHDDTQYSSTAGSARVSVTVSEANSAGDSAAGSTANSAANSLKRESAAKSRAGIAVDSPVRIAAGSSGQGDGHGGEGV